MKSTKLPGTVALNAEEREALREYVERVGEPEAIQRLGVSRPTLIRACGGFTIRRGSAAVLRAWLKPAEPASEASP